MTQPQQPMPSDPDSVPEVICTGATNLMVTGPIATLTFTNIRKKVAHTFGDLTPDTMESVVRARIVMPIETLIELRNLIERTIKVEAISPGSNARN